MRLAAIIFAMAGPTLAGIFIVALLTIDMSAGMAAIAGAAGAGFAIAVPVAIMVARRLGTRS